jgi:alpha-beta hydrolase superfamily lysophospholipase
MFFSDPVHDEFASLILGFAPYGGGDVGEVQALSLQVKEGDDDSFFDAFVGLARRRIEEGDVASAKGHSASAYDCWLRAACLLGMAYHPLYGTPVDPRLVDALHLQMGTFDRAMALLDPPGQKLDIPYQDTTLPGYFVRAPGHANEVRPVVIVGGGWDSTYIENYVGIGIAALRRGYHVLLYDGPGQGRPLVDEGRPLRHDWDKVVTPVVDAALAIDVADPDRIAYHAWSLGGYFTPRVAAYEHRLAAIVADPGQLDVGVKFFELMKAFGLGADALAKLPAIDPEDEKTVLAAVEANRSMRWKIVQRGYWTNGATGLAAYLAEMAKWRLEPDEIAAIRCPTLVTAAESDFASSNAKELYEALTCPKAFVEFKDADGAGAHCEALNRSMANRVIIDWLDETLASAAG